jgi:hypothetical protein
MSTPNLPCPFCGGTELTECDGYVGCWNCEARGPATASSGGGLGSLDLWNRRTLGRSEYPLCGRLLVDGQTTCGRCILPAHEKGPCSAG